MNNFEKLKFLYVEDDSNIAEIYILMIKDHFENIEVEWFADGILAKKELEKFPDKYNLIISDYKLQNGSGGELFQFVNGQMLGIPFIMLTGIDCSSEPELKGFFSSHVRNAILTKPVSIEEIEEKVKWCLESQTDLFKIYDKAAKSCDEKIPINSDVFLRLNMVPCAVYLKLNDGKFVKVINKNEIFEKSLIQKLILKGVVSFYVNRSELSSYSDTVVRSLAMIVKIKKSKTDQMQKSQLNNTAINVLTSNLLKCGFSEALMKATDEVLQLQLDLIKSTDGLSEFVEKYQLLRKAASDHTRIVNYILFDILKDLSWDSESTIHKMSLTALLHDVTLPDHFYKQVMNQEQIEKLSKEDKRIYYSHPEESAHLAKNFDSITGGMEQFILEHHELPDGKGFPRKLNFNHVHPLSAVLHLADYVADLIWENNFDMDLVVEELKSKRSFYKRGFYRKPFESICRIFKVPAR